MPPSTPSWWAKRSLIAYILLPFSCLYYLAHKIKQASARSYKSSLPVICIGGVVAGGSGKTPVLHAIAELLEKENLFERPVILTRGYGGEYAGPTRVDPESHTAKEVGDEALLHAQLLPTIVSKDRASGAKLAEAMGADIILLDDGLQNPSLSKTISFLVLDGEYLTGNGFILPAGPLRETFKDAETKCAGIVINNAATDFKSPLPVFETTLKLVSDHDKSLSYYAFAGIGRPEKFERTLRNHGFGLTGFKSFPDHHRYSEEDMEKLLSASGDARLITTAKDIVKIPASYHDRIHVLEISYEFKEPYKITSLIRERVGQ